MTKKTAIVLFNLGGPDKPEAVRPFLFNLFNDPAIIGLPGPFRWLLAKFISARRAPVAREIYAHIGGKSPLLEQTNAQARALEAALTGRNGSGAYRVFVCMRYWHPMSDETARAVRTYSPDEIVLLPLYPQYSTTTTGSSIKDWHRAAAKAGIDKPTRTICCYPTDGGLIRAQADLVQAAIAKLAGEGTPGVTPKRTPRVLFSAHGLPKKVIDTGDPYQWQVEQTVAAVVAELGARGVGPFDPVVCYQSRVGPLEWIGPSTEDELARAGKEGVAVAVVPIAFVSEHSETLVELDIEYRHLAEKAGVPAYERVATVQVSRPFIEGLAGAVRVAPRGPGHLEGSRICPDACGRCPMSEGTR
ncbi:MAG: ferrochelatase [Rhodospirillaceae bacterium]